MRNRNYFCRFYLFDQVTTVGETRCYIYVCLIVKCVKYPFIMWQRNKIKTKLIGKKTSRGFSFLMTPVLCPNGIPCRQNISRPIID